MTSVVGFEVQDTEGRIILTEGTQEELADIDHEEGQVSGIGDRRWLNVHEILQAPVLFSVAEIELQLEAQAVVVNELWMAQVQVGAKENDMSASLGSELGLDDDHDIERFGKLLIPQLRLVDVGANAVLSGCLPQIAGGNVGVVEFVTVLGMRATTRVSPYVREIEGSIIAQLGNEVQTATPHNLAGVVMTVLAVQSDMLHLNDAGDEFQLLPDHLLQQGQFGGQHHLALVLVLTSFRPAAFAWLAFGLTLFLLCLAGCFIRFTAYHLFDHRGIGATLLAADQRQGQERQPCHWLAIQRREKAVQPIASLARLRHHRLITGQQIDIRWIEQMLAKEQSEHRRPGYGRIKEALHCPIAASFASPA